MTHCPTCHCKLLRKTDDAIKLTILRCSACKKISCEGLDVFITAGPGSVDQLVRLKAQADEEQARYQLFMEAPIGTAGWESVG